MDILQALIDFWPEWIVGLIRYCCAGEGGKEGGREAGGRGRSGKEEAPSLDGGRRSGDGGFVTKQPSLLTHIFTPLLNGLGRNPITATEMLHSSKPLTYEITFEWKTYT